ncbi:membrane-bound serine protease (ClpP class) [Desulfatibacillum alkenivorans DSM 16219]|jgi:membrane-bound serine protease (ClpP class)|uniref:Membrane-bound serine protease (ClpP class) n=1 Tax=Desulfatibacillum alkenivorans DSM 16219 TaxID=1121393 RepID=A0A1M6YH98_9BACT|nr:nodulation protein NfeD [Desulfatibacillum alkenivorans]SHL17647.1 membrane-bound serine protease (ClpP class) [Desulfatibacillum alkenivorans DSM 16219]
MHILTKSGLVFALALLVFGVSVGLAPLAWAEDGEVMVMEISQPIGAATAFLMEKCLDDAEEAGYACVIFQLDTPGGALESMRRIVMAFLDAKVPVVVYVFPPGARAASAGVMIANAADVAVMAPATNIGAAHPVSGDGKEINETMDSKVTNDAVAGARSVAEKRGRNAEWIEKAIRESVSATESEALELNVIDFIAKDMPELLEKLDGMEIPDKGVLRTKDRTVINYQTTLREKILSVIANPNIAFLLMSLGMLGLYFEFANPGAVFPGVVGVISILVALYALHTLPVNYVGIMLILLSGVFFVLETQIASHGALAAGGIVSIFLGATMLFDYDVTGLRVAWSVLIPTVMFVAAFFAIVAALVVKAHKGKIRTGEDGLVGEKGKVTQAVSETQGKVLVHAEIWNARFLQPMAPGDPIRVASVDGLLLIVEKDTEK